MTNWPHVPLVFENDAGFAAEDVGPAPASLLTGFMMLCEYLYDLHPLSFKWAVLILSIVSHI